MSPSALKPIGINRIFTVWNILRSTIHRQKVLALQGKTLKMKRGPKTCLADAHPFEVTKFLLRNSPFLGIRSSPSFVRSPEVNGCDKRFIRTFNGNCSYSHDLPVSKNCTPRCRNSPIVSTTFGSSGVLDTKRPRSTDAVSSWMPRD